MDSSTPISDPALASQLLGDMKRGEHGIIQGFSTEAGQSDLEDRLREMGFDEDLPIRLLHQSPFGGDPIAVAVGQMTVALRRHDAIHIFVKSA